MLIEQAIYGGQDAGGYRFLARSADFVDDWLAEAERLCTGFGERPAGVTCPAALFARPFGKKHVAVVQVADQGADDTGRPGALAFRLLVLPARLYADLAGDLFWISDQLPPPWQRRGELESLPWTAGPPPGRTVEQLQRVLDVEPDRTQTLLGGVQILVDGGRLVFVRHGPNDKIIRDLWALLPTSTRYTTWPATFAFGNAHGFHAVVVPGADGPAFEHYTREAEAGDYPEGAYELALQHAVESADQADLEGLLARRSRSQTMRLGIALLVFFAVMALIIHFPTGRGPEGDKGSQVKKQDEPLKLPALEDVPSMGREDRARLAARLDALGKALGITLPRGDSEDVLADDLVKLDRRLDEKLGAKKPRRDPGPLEKLGPVQRRLRALLWKHGVPEHSETALNTDELAERLQRKLVKEGVIKEQGSD
jgi:hypothetical protein